MKFTLKSVVNGDITITNHNTYSECEKIILGNVGCFAVVDNEISKYKVLISADHQILTESSWVDLSHAPKNLMSAYV